MKQLLWLFYIGLCSMVVFSCKQDVPGPIDNDGVAPGPVSNIRVKNLNGAAEITFDVPPAEDLLYIRAVYTTPRGEIRETKVSRFNNSLTVVGFGSTDPCQVSIYAVDKGENASEPVQVTVNPKTPIMKIVRDGITASEEFGGINVKFENKTEADLAIVVLANDSLGHFVPARTYNTKQKLGDFSVRDLKAEKAKFGFFVRDRWGNLSDTLYLELKPLFETKFDFRKMRGLMLPTDAGLGYGGKIEPLFDGTNYGTAYEGFYHSNDAARMPQWLSFDMGITAKVSRLVYYMRPGYFYDWHAPRDVEIWGTASTPAADGSFSNWVLLATHKQVKVSGLPNGQLSQTDIENGNAGESIAIPASAPKVRYIRFKTLRNWTDGTYVNFNEISVWGDPN